MRLRGTGRREIGRRKLHPVSLRARGGAPVLGELPFLGMLLVLALVPASLPWAQGTVGPSGLEALISEARVAGALQAGELQPYDPQRSYDFVIRVPVELHQIHQGIDAFRVTCDVRAGATFEGDLGTTDLVPIPQGEYSGTVEVGIDTTDERATLVRFYACRLYLHHAESGRERVPCAAGEGCPVWFQARAEEPFDWRVTGPLP